MLCQSCGKNQANTHIKKIINGEVTEYRLCEHCAIKLGYTPNMFEGFGMDFDNFLGSFFENSKPKLLDFDTERCSFCGSSFSDISNNGKVGCAKCYDTFFDRLMPSIKRIHGNTKHSGKFASTMGKQNVIENKISSLEEKMKMAISEQNFEEAAKLRDEIKELKLKEESLNE